MTVENEQTETTEQQTETPESTETQTEETPAEQQAEGEQEGEKKEEAKPEEPKAEPPKPSPKMSKALEEAAAAERRARQDRLELKRAQEALKVESQKMRASVAQMQADLELAKTNPFAFYEKLGLSPNALAKAFMEHKEPSESERALAEAKRAREEVALLHRRQQEAAERAKQQARAYNEKQFRNETTDYVTANADRWELINAYGAQNFVAEHVIAHHKMFGTILSVDAAADQVEKQLEEKLEGVSQTKKFSSKFKPSASPKPPAAPAKPKPTSLTNNVTPSAGATAHPILSEEERLKRAMDALTFED